MIRFSSSAITTLGLLLFASVCEADTNLRRKPIRRLEDAAPFDHPSYQNNVALKGYSKFYQYIAEDVPGAPSGLIKQPKPENDKHEAPVQPTKEDVQTFMDIFDEPLVMSMGTSTSPSAAPSEAPTFVIVPQNTPLPTPPPSPRTSTPSSAPSATPTLVPTDQPSSTPTKSPTESPSQPPTGTPTQFNCGLTEESRREAILAILDTVSDPVRIRDPTDARGKATEWLLNGDERVVCPGNDKFLQRWVLAVIYFSTGGDDWDKCMATPDPADPDNCGAENPFVSGEERFLSSETECSWAGISCTNACVTKIEFEENNLVGTIPEEIGLLTDLEFWGMERGGLTSTIPTSVGALTKLTFLDLDYNMLTGTLTPELLSLSALTVFDLNDNKFTGRIDGIVAYPDMIWLQLHRNSFEGSIPSNIGSFSNLSAFTLHETDIEGPMPVEVCNLLAPNITDWPNPSGSLSSLIADCKPGGGVMCPCCTVCR